MSFVPVPGSEAFNSRGADADTLRAAAAPHVTLHQPESATRVDPVTYEVVRHRLAAITEMMGEALKQQSGSLVVTDCNDFDVGMSDELGDLVQVGLFNTQLVAAMGLAIKWTLQNRADNPGIKPGDMFLCNDPWVGGGLHQNDVGIFAPLFHDGELFCWTAGVAHQADVGGVSPGSWTPRAEDVFWESLPTPPVKIVSEGRVQRDVEDVYLRRSRTPRIVALDLRAKIGSNKVAHQHLERLIAKYGPDTVKAVMYGMLDDAEQRVRNRLTSIPDGQWRATSYQEQSMENDRGLHNIVLTMTKQDSRLIFDFRGTSPQSGMINCTYAGMYGGIMSHLLTQLCGDIPWASGGIGRCIEIVSEEGTMNNCTFPGGVGKGSVGSAWATSNAVTECLSQMLNVDANGRQRAKSLCNGTWQLCVMAGLNQRNTPFATMITDPVGAGLGSLNWRDGVDAGGAPCIPMGRVPDVEMNEFMYPMLYLWRREETDSGGPGTYRGGMGQSFCFVVHNAPAPLAMIIAGSGKAVPQNRGIAGGYPGSTSIDTTIRNAPAGDLLSRGVIPSSLEEVEGETEVHTCEEETLLMPGDVHYMRLQGGGGFGDPLLRDPSMVREEVVTGRVSEQAARDVYGVVIHSGWLDGKATDRRRQELRGERRRSAEGSNGQHQDEEMPIKVNPNWPAVDSNMRILESRDGVVTIQCTHCDTRIEIPASVTDLRPELSWVTGPPSLAGPQIETNSALYIDVPTTFSQYCCPTCLTAIRSEVVPAPDATPVGGGT